MQQPEPRSPERRLVRSTAPARPMVFPDDPPVDRTTARYIEATAAERLAAEKPRAAAPPAAPAPRKVAKTAKPKKATKSPGFSGRSFLRPVIETKGAQVAKERQEARRLERARAKGARHARKTGKAHEQADRLAKAA